MSLGWGGMGALGGGGGGTQNFIVVPLLNLD